MRVSVGAGWISLLPAFALGLPESDKCNDSAADQLVRKGGPGSRFIVLFLLFVHEISVARGFYLN